MAEICGILGQKNHFDNKKVILASVQILRVSIRILSSILSWKDELHDFISLKIIEQQIYWNLAFLIVKYH